jgi:4-amino-4-deoxy-L-arabinose transferase-like glycosyltransferase
MTPRTALLALAGLTLLRFAIAGSIELSPDEAYYWVWSKTLQGGYYDHPPMVALWIRAGTLLFGDTALGVRLLGPLSVALGSVMVYRMGADLAPNRGAGLFAAAALNATLFIGAGAAVMTPETPLVFFWTATLFCLVRLIVTGNGRWWLWVGLAIGAAMASKYTTIFLVVGILLWMLVVPDGRRWFGRPEPWIGAALSLAIFAPVVLWNLEHGWAGFLKQGGRVGAGDSGLQLRFLGELLGGQIGLATPILFLLFVVGVAVSLRSVRRRESGIVLLVASIAPSVVYFLVHALHDRVQANWPAAIYPAAALCMATSLGERWERWKAPAIMLGFALTALVYVQALTGALPLPRRADPTLQRLAGWGDFAAQVEAERQRTNTHSVIAEEYGLAGLLAFYLPRATPVYAVGERWRLFDLPQDAPEGAGLYVRTLRRGDTPPTHAFAEAKPSDEVTRQRRGTAAETYNVMIVLRPVAGLAAARLPSR